MPTCERLPAGTSRPSATCQAPSRFMAEHHPRFLKNYRAKWEGAFRGAMPKQLLPYVTLRYCTINGFREGIRENALLAKAWGMQPEYVVHAVASSAYYMNGLPAVSVAAEALTDVLKDWTK